MQKREREREKQRETDYRMTKSGYISLKIKKVPLKVPHFRVLPMLKIPKKEMKEN